MLKMKFKYKSKKICGVLSVVPQNFKTFDEEMENYKADKKRTERLKRVMGYERHHLVEEGVTVSDLAVFGMEYLFENNFLRKEEIGALILVTESPDYFLPPTSNIIQGRLNLPQGVLCLDINQGCAGYIVGIIEACSLLEHLEGKKVILINADILSRKTSKADRNSYPLIGDAASISILKNADESEIIQGEIKMDGSRFDALMIPAGGFKMPSSSETSILQDDGSGNCRSLDNLIMKGKDIFDFVQTEVPPLVESVIQSSHLTKEQIEFYLFHQPNKFMVEKLADEINIPYEKIPSNIVTNFGNSSGVTIPLNITFNLGERLLNENFQVCFAGFGVGLAWGAMLLKIGEFNFCQTIYFA